MLSAIGNVMATLAGWIIAVIAATGYAGVVGLMVLESACMPLPSVIIMPVWAWWRSPGRRGAISIPPSPMRRDGAAAVLWSDATGAGVC